MKTLQEIIKGMYNDAGVGQSIHKHLSAVGINEWEDITRGSLYDLRDYLATVLVFKAGKEMRGPKWKFISSHSARISTATCLDRRGVQIGDICQLLQHSSVTTTERYIVRDRIQLSDEAMKFFK